MATTTDTRILSLDVLRGVAVMGILGMNAAAFAMPQQAYLDPLSLGQVGMADLWTWVLSFIFVDGKMRGLFSLLFGASMLLVIERADARDGNGGSVHARRMAWLLLFGLAHFLLIWWGDILSLYAMVGFVAADFVRRSPASLLKTVIGIMVVVSVLLGLVSLSPLLLEAAASAPDAEPEMVRQWQALEADLSGTAAVATDLAVHRGSWLQIVSHKLEENWFAPLVQLLMSGPETLALMLLGMWGLKSGFMTASWERRRYAKVALICFAITVPAYGLLAYAAYAGDFRPSATLAVVLGGATPFRPVMTIGYAALILYLFKSGAHGWLGTRIAAAGRAAFTNYLGTSIVMTTIFYGYGLGFYGQIGRAELWFFVLATWAAMLLWSKPWLERYRYGPFEWLWRSLARWERQPMRREAKPIAAPAE